MCFWRRVTFWISTQFHTAVNVRLHVLFNVKELREKRPKYFCFCSSKYIKCWVAEFNDLPRDTASPQGEWSLTSVPPVHGPYFDPHCGRRVIALSLKLVFLFSQTCNKTHLICICRSHDLGNMSHQTLTFIRKTLTAAFQTHQNTLEVEDHITTQSRLHSFSPQV